MYYETAYAKINLTLHVTGQDPRGYHFLDSLVAFTEFGDELRASRAEEYTLRVTGPKAAGLSAGDDNLVLKAARLMVAPADIVLNKNLPIASGIGGGSADAAAALRLLGRMTGAALPSPDALLALGADVPVCFESRAAHMQGIGADLRPAPIFPSLWVVLVNSGQSVSTPQVFKSLKGKNNAEMPLLPERFSTAQDVGVFLHQCRNDLEAPAAALVPEILVVKRAIQAQLGCILARMSGSGATCFGLFATHHEAEKAATRIQSAEPTWWCVATALRP